MRWNKAAFRKIRKASSIESLEPRKLLTTFTVTSGDNSGAGTLRQAIADAVDGDSIVIDSSVPLITLSSPIYLLTTLTITGAGVGQTAISGGNETQIFAQFGTSYLDMSDLTLTNGNAGYSSGGAFSGLGSSGATFERVNFTNNQALTGGAISNGSTTTLNFVDCELTNNSAVHGGAGRLDGITNFTRTTIAYNQTAPTSGTSTRGGAFVSYSGTHTFVNSTIANNSSIATTAWSTADGGAIAAGDSTLYFTNCTIAHNTASGAHYSGAGGIDLINSTLGIRNSIVAANVGSVDLNVGSGSFDYQFSGHIVVGSLNDGSYYVPTSTVNGMAANPLDVRLGSLGRYGVNNTLTIPLYEDSPALDAGYDLDAPATDQRGAARSGTSDLGAFEGTVLFPVTLTTSTIPDPTAESEYSSQISARDLDSADTITFTVTSKPQWMTTSSGGRGILNLGGTPQTLDIGSGSVTVEVSDGTHTDTQTYTFTVAPPTNLPPSFTTDATLSDATARQGYAAFIDATDGNPSSYVEISVVSLPAWMSATSITARQMRLSGEPGDSEVGQYTITLQVTDGLLSVTKDFTLTVQPRQNHAPQFYPIELPVAYVGIPFSYDISAFDEDDDALMMYLLDAPAWLQFEEIAPGTIHLFGTPDYRSTGWQEVLVAASDSVATPFEVFDLNIISDPVRLVGETLYLVGAEDASDIRVSILDGDTLKVVRDGQRRYFDLNDVDSLIVTLYDEADFVSISAGNVSTTLYGGDGDDTLAGGAGADNIFGGEGDDLITTGAGRNRVEAGDGDDTITGGNSTDRLSGGEGDDLISGRNGNDKLFGDDGDDFINAGSGRNRANGGEGDDTLIGGSSIDRLFGDEGDDQLFGGKGNDYLSGGSGIDLLVGGKGYDAGQLDEDDQAQGIETIV